MDIKSTVGAADAGFFAWKTGVQTLVDVVRHWAELQPASAAYVYVADGKEHAISYHELDRRAKEVAQALRAKGKQGTTALMLYPLGLEFVEAFFGCLYAGVVAVPMQAGRGKSAHERWSAVVRDCDAQTVLTTSVLGNGVAASFRSVADLASLEILETDRIRASAEDVDGEELPAPSPRAVAFLQYTSGSTSQPKGTVVTHRNIMANQAMLRSVFKTDRSSVIASWLPIFHDMGLIGNVLHAAYLGVPAVLISTLGFVKSPILWLRTIDRYKATFSGAPNFAYDLCVAKTTPVERAGLDLSHWRVAFNGSEPVRQRTLEQFCKTFAPYGFRRDAFVPTYGLAEATLVVSGSGGDEPNYFNADGRSLKEDVVAKAHDPAAIQVLVSNGRYDHGDQNIVIVDPVNLRPCSGTRVGEIWISGSHVAEGYWKNESATQETFRASIAGDEQRYLRTGDLGFVTEKGLFITGRLKDLIILRGQNIYPQDIELTVEVTCPELRPGCTAAFALEGVNDVEVVIVAEIEKREAHGVELLARVVRAVQERHELTVHRVVLVRRNTVPKTTSGKIQRNKCRQQLARGDYGIIDEWRNPAAQPASELAQRIGVHAAAWIAKHQNLPPASISHQAPLASFGLDSILKVELVHSLERLFNISVPESSFFALESIDDLKSLVAPPESAPPSKPNPERVSALTHSRRGGPVLPAFSTMTWELRDD